MPGYVAWLWVALVCIVFVTMCREGAIHHAAWDDACHTLQTGGAIEGAWPQAIEFCRWTARP